ncbi:hypothetical protein LOK49_LG04G03519 [Camellia lanceoleosa]|uniref:Uncharacterized protein n=1 Tax=Camellia lanceoleosa TaxID=1840588 RepID=A0ACC0HW12_9ERIC|nr:hypothetical protein LOK49_LG04G03519 [Camellia lanceoleosa]
MDWREESGGGVDVEMEEDDEDGVEDEEEKSVNSDGLADGVEAPEFDKVVLTSKESTNRAIEKSEVLSVQIYGLCNVKAIGDGSCVMVASLRLRGGGDGLLLEIVLG